MKSVIGKSVDCLLVLIVFICAMAIGTLSWWATVGTLAIVCAVSILLGYIGSNMDANATEHATVVAIVFISTFLGLWIGTDTVMLSLRMAVVTGDCVLLGILVDYLMVMPPKNDKRFV